MECQRKGASLLDGYMEDLATDRIYRLMIAQRVRHSNSVEILDDAACRFGTRRNYYELFDEQLERLMREGANTDDVPAAATLREAREISENDSRAEFNRHKNIFWKFPGELRDLKSKEHSMSTNGSNGANGNGTAMRMAVSISLIRTGAPIPWSGITRPYSYSDVLRLRGSIQIEYTLAPWCGAALELDAHGRLCSALAPSREIKPLKWCRPDESDYGSGCKWRRMETRGDVYPDQSLYPCDSARTSSSASIARCCAPTRLNRRRKEIRHVLLAPIVADRKRDSAAR